MPSVSPTRYQQQSSTSQSTSTGTTLLGLPGSSSTSSSADGSSTAADREVLRALSLSRQSSLASLADQNSRGAATDTPSVYSEEDEEDETDSDRSSPVDLGWCEVVWWGKGGGRANRGQGLWQKGDTVYRVKVSVLYRSFVASKWSMCKGMGDFPSFYWGWERYGCASFHSIKQIVCQHCVRRRERTEANQRDNWCMGDLLSRP